MRCLLMAALVLALVSLSPCEATAGFQPDLLVKRAVEPDTAYLGGGIFESTAQTQSTSQPAFPGTPALYRVLLKNSGDQPDRFLVQGTGVLAGAAIRFLDAANQDRTAELGPGFTTATLAPGEALSYLVQVTPTQFLLGASFRVSVQATSQGDPARLDQVKTETVACSSTAAVILSAPPDAFGAPGSTVYYPYTLTNVGNTANSFSLAASGASGWASRLVADDGAGGGTSDDAQHQPGETTPVAATGFLAPGASFHFFLAIQVPGASVDGARADTQVTAAGAGTATADQVTTAAVSATVLVAETVRNLSQGSAFATSTTALPGEVLEYRLALTNAGTLAATGVSLASPVPSGTTPVAGSLRLASSPSGDGPPCSAALCGSVASAGGTLTAQLGEGAAASTGGTLAPGKTIYLFFRVLVE